MTNKEYLKSLSGTQAYYDLISKIFREIELSYYTFTIENDILEGYIIADFAKWLKAERVEEKEKGQ